MKMEYFFLFSHFFIHLILAILGGDCNTSEDCETVEHSICESNTCTCKPGFTNNMGKCDCKLYAFSITNVILSFHSLYIHFYFFFL